jgi:parallel beta-helix repeat protein
MRPLPSQLRLARLFAPAVLVITMAVLGDGSALAASPSCGDTITQDTTLTADLTNCPGDGLDVGADGITLNLNGHTIDGTVTQPLACGDTPADADGVRVGGHDGVTIENGTIQQFSIGVNGGAEDDGMSNAYLHDLAVRGNGQHGIEIGVRHFPPSATAPTNDDNVVEHNTIEGTDGCGGSDIVLSNTVRNRVGYNRTHRSQGIGVCCSEHAIVEHNFVDNDNLGSEFAFGGADIEVVFGGHNLVRNNNVTGSGADGIAIGEGEHDTVARDNHSHGNGGAGVLLNEAIDDRVENNQLDHNGFVGVISFVGDRNTISGNHIADISGCPPDFCGLGVGIAGGDANVVAANDIARVALDGVAVVALDPGDTTSNTLVRANSVRAAAVDGYAVGGLGDGTVTDTTLTGNRALMAGHDGFNVFVAGTTLTGNSAFGNGNLGIEAVDGTIDGGGNLAHGNGNPAQCTGVSCG